MESDEGKLFVGGIAWDTTEEKLTDYFSKYGDVSQTIVMRDKTTGRPRGFAFVIFSDPSALDAVILEKHTIDGRLVEAKKALSREEQSARQDQSGRGSGGAGNIRTKKIFVGGLPATLTEEGFRQYFETYGQVTDAVIMFDQATQRPRGFGFITFDSEDSVDRVLHKNFHELDGKDVEVKRALPKEASPGGNNRGGGYQSSRGNAGSYDNRMEGNRYMQQQNYSSYPGYNASGYSGYGGPTSYGSYGGYSMGGYGGGAGGYGGAAAVAGYGGGPNAMKAAYQSSGYGSGGYGPSAAAAAAAWNTGVAGGVSSQTFAGYGNSGYNVGGYGAVGGRSGGGHGNSDGGEQAGGAGGYMGGGYGETNRNSGYGNSGWKADHSQVDGGYGDSQSWQGQQ